MKIVTPQQMRDIEDRSEELGVSKDTLMENAGQSIAKYLLNTTKNLVGTRVVLLVGQGNNGGDGIVAATRLDQLGAKVAVYLCAAVPKSTAMPEVLGDAGLYFDPEDVDEIAATIKSMLIDKKLCRGLSQKARDRSKQFAWELTVKQTMTALRDQEYRTLF